MFSQIYGVSKNNVSCVKFPDVSINIPSHSCYTSKEMLKKVSSMLDTSIYTPLGSVTEKVLFCLSVRLFKFSLL